MVRTLSARPLVVALGVLTGVGVALAQVGKQSNSAARPQVTRDPVGSEARVSVQATGAAIAAVATAVDLSAADTAALVARLPASKLATPTNGPKLVAPPRPAATPNPITFQLAVGKVGTNPPSAPSVDATRPLAAPTISPSGEIGYEDQIRIAFAEPMVPLGTVASRGTALATLEPAVPGDWRWLSPTLLTFEPKAKRLPMATTYTVRVNGAAALSGARYDKPTAATFVTKPVALIEVPEMTLLPSSPLRLTVDQDIDSAALSAFVEVRGNGEQRVDFFLATVAQAHAALAPDRRDDREKPTVPPLGSKRDLVLLPKTKWPSGTLKIGLRKGAPSAEGPRRSTQVTWHRVEVAPPFFAKGLRCGWAYDERRPKSLPKQLGCEAGNMVEIEFSNPVGEITPAQAIIAGTDEDGRADGHAIRFSVPTNVGKTFRFNIDPSIRDEYGQPLQPGTDQLALTVRPVKMLPLEKYFQMPTGLVVLDPRFTIPQLPIEVHAYDRVAVRLHRVVAEDYLAFAACEAKQAAEVAGGSCQQWPGTLVKTEAHDVGRNYLGSLRVDLRPALAGAATGHVLAIVDVSAGGKTTQQRVWLQVTTLGLAGTTDRDAQVKTYRFDNGKDLAFVDSQVRLVSDQASGPANTMATLAATAHGSVGQAAVIAMPTKAARQIAIATVGTETAFVDVSNRVAPILEDTVLWYVTDDRFTYKPGEVIYFKGFVRVMDRTMQAALQIPAHQAMRYVIKDALGNTLGQGSGKLSANGSFAIEAKLPATSKRGGASLQVELPGLGKVSHRRGFAIEDFAAPPFAVTVESDAQLAGAAHTYVGDQVTMRASAAYFAGGGLPGATADWSVNILPAHYTPPGWGQFTFGTQTRGWHRGSSSIANTSLQSVLASNSQTEVQIGFHALANNTAMVVQPHVTVADQDRQRVRGEGTKFLVHPAAIYVGVRRVPKQDAVAMIATNVDGEPVANRTVEVVVEQYDWRDWRSEKAVPKQSTVCKLTSGMAPVTCAYQRVDQTYVTYRATAIDDAGRTAHTRLDFAWSSDDSKALAIATKQDKYQPGKPVAVTIITPTVPALATISAIRRGVVTQIHTRLTQPRTDVELPAAVALAPGFTVKAHAMVLRKARDGEGQVPQYQLATRDVAVDVEGERLIVVTKPSAKIVEPGAMATIEAKVTHDGMPVAGAEVALFAVDEAVLALSSSQFGDPLTPFYPPVYDLTREFDSLEYLYEASHPSRPPGFEREKYDPMAGGYGLGGHGVGSGGAGSYGYGSGRGSGAAIALRNDFRSNAVFAPTLITDSQGRVAVQVKMPENLTKFRIVALATSGVGRFGKGEGAIVTQKKLGLRILPPRFLTIGDTVEVPVTVQNLLPVAKQIKVAMRGDNLRALRDQGKLVTVPAGGRAELRFGFATQALGQAGVAAVIESDGATDAAFAEFAVDAPITTESFASYGELDAGVRAEAIAVPTQLVPNVGGVQVSLASTQLQSLIDGYKYLERYPFECAEQRSARLLTNAVVAPVIRSFDPTAVASDAQAATQMARDMAAFGETQNRDGGWGYFEKMQSDPYVSVQVLDALTVAGAKAPFVKASEKFVDKLAKRQGNASRVDVHLRVYALTVLASRQVDVRKQALALAQQTERTADLDTQARLLQLLAGWSAAAEVRSKLLTALTAQARETASVATVATSAAEDEFGLVLPSDAKTTGLALMALMAEKPDHYLVPKLARGVLNLRKNGRWASTQANLAALRALTAYFARYEQVTPDFTGEVWAGQAYAQAQFVGRQTAVAQASVPWRELGSVARTDVTVRKTGAGRMYYRVGVEYAQAGAAMPAMDAGFVVQRSYRGLDSPRDVVRLPDGSWQIALGARVQVVVDVIASTPRFAVAVVDPLPAGLVAVNRRLANAEHSVDAFSQWDYVAVRDDRVELFDMGLPGGTARITYTARAMLPGTFSVAGAKAEEMYTPETFGRSAATSVVIK